MKSIFLMLFSWLTGIVSLAAFILFGVVPRANAEPLSVYTYDSFLGKGSLGELVKDQFEKKTGLQIKYVGFGSAAEALNQMVIEGENTPAELLVGIDNSLLQRAKATGFFSALPSEWVKSLHQGVDYDSEHFFLPYDFGFLALLHDTRRNSKGVNLKGQSLQQFVTQPGLGKQVVIQDPRTSSIGLAFLLWTKELYPNEAEWNSFWKSFSQKLLTIAPGWSAAYGMFLKKEADWVLSYTTSPAYHIEKEKLKAIHALELKDSLFAQIEGVGLTKFSKRPEVAKRFVEVLLSAEIQNVLGSKQWMYPALKAAKIPPSFPKLPSQWHIGKAPSEAQRKEWLKQWSLLVSSQK